MSDQNAANQNDADEVLIFLDMDGVIANFMKHVDDQNKRTPEGEIDMAALDFEWWSTIPAFDGARKFYDDLCRQGRVRFLTGPSLHEGAYGGKAKWIKKFVPERGMHILRDLIVCHAKSKFLVAGPGRILVDDKEENIREWEAAGGIGILHTGDFKETRQKLREAVEQIKAGAKPSAAPVPRQQRGSVRPLIYSAGFDLVRARTP
jgi:hypothetical protein